MNTTTHLDAISAFIFIGVFQGLILSFFFIIKPSSNIKANRYQGLLLLSLTLCILELETKQYFLDNLASLSELAKKIGESPHHVSQVLIS